jgi:hypothetical protein
MLTEEQIKAIERRLNRCNIHLPTAPNNMAMQHEEDVSLLIQALRAERAALERAAEYAAAESPYKRATIEYYINYFREVKNDERS